MTRLSQTLTHSYPRKLIWWMDCDGCNTVGSDPKWSQHDLPLDDFRAKGWVIDHFDLCPACVSAGLREIPSHRGVLTGRDMHAIFRPTAPGVTA